MVRKKNKSDSDIKTDPASMNVKNALKDIEMEASVFLTEQPEAEGFLPEVAETDTAVLVTEESAVKAATQVEETFFAAALAEAEETADVPAIEGSELDAFEAADIEELEFVEDEQIHSIVESILFASDRPVSLASIQQVFKGTNVKKDKVRKVLESLAVGYAGGDRGVVLEEITGGYQLRTKVDNMSFLKRTIKTRAFKLSGPALETLSIVAYKQPVVKMEVDQIRGVESGHLLRALMEKGLVSFESKAEHLPGKPMQYGTTRRFLEIFGLRNLKELPTLSQIDELLPEGIGDETEEIQTLSMVTESLAENSTSMSYSEGEEELGLIENQLTAISTSSEFFEQEKIRQKRKREEEKAQDIRDAVAVGEVVSKRDLNWLAKFENPEPILEPVISTEEPVMVLVDASFDGTATADDESEEDADDELPMYEEADDELIADSSNSEVDAGADNSSEEGHV